MASLPWFSPSRLQEAEKQNQSLKQELAALREELRARGPGGGWPPACRSLSKSATPASWSPKGPCRAVETSLSGLCCLPHPLLASTY